MDLTICRDTHLAGACSEELETGADVTPPQRRRGHLQLVPEPEVPATILATAEGQEASTDDGLASVRYLPTSITREREHDGAEGKDRGAAAPEVDQGARPRDQW